MKARFRLAIACVVGAMGGVLSACAGSEGTTTQEGGGGGMDSTAPEGSGGEAGNVDSGAGADAKFDADATVRDTGSGDSVGPDVAAEGMAQDAMVSDTSTAETGGEDSTVDSGGSETGVDTGPADSGGADVISDSADEGDGPQGVDGGTDAGGDAGQDSGIGQGPVCQNPDGGIYFCNAGDHCCGNAMTRESTCAISCDGDAGFSVIDCPGASGDGGCGSLICCATLVLGGGIPPACPPQSLASSCVTSCGGAAGENPPSLCGGTSVVRLCTSATDCASDTPNPHCCNYGSPPSPVNWCVSDFIYNLGLQNSCL